VIKKLLRQKLPDGGAMNETPETGAATTNVAAVPGSAKASPPASPGPAPAGTSATVSPRRRRGLLLILFAVACAVAIAAAVVTVVLVTQRPRQAHAAASRLHATVFSLHPGQCFNSLPNGIAGAHAVRCRRPHDGEIYGDFRVAGRSWPGSAALAAQARQGCQSRLSGYLNPQLNTTGLAESYAYPTEGAWAAGVHSVICEIRGTQGKLTGSVRASGA
jgi:putative regulator of septum formation